MSLPTKHPARNYPFILDLLAGWQGFVSGEQFTEEYQKVVHDLYQQAAAEMLGEEIIPLNEQMMWLYHCLPSLAGALAELPKPVFTPSHPLISRSTP